MIDRSQSIHLWGSNFIETPGQVVGVRANRSPATSLCFALGLVDSDETTVHSWLRTIADFTTRVEVAPRQVARVGVNWSPAAVLSFALGLIDTDKAAVDAIARWVASDAWAS